MSRKFNRRQRRILGSYTRQMRKFWVRVRADIGDEKTNAWYATGELEHLGDHARPLIDSLQRMNLKMREARK